MTISRLGALRKKVAREAAILLYTSEEKEYKQAKCKAAKTLRTWILPSNREIAEELDKIAEEHEGVSRKKRLIQMRKEALEIMKTLEDFKPRLIGSVWRGTANRKSDIDIVVFSDPSSVIDRLREGGFNILGVEKVATTKRGEMRDSLHVYCELVSSDKVEIVIRKPEEAERMEPCEIYGDVVKGLNIEELERVLENDPLQKFLPK